MRTQQAGATAGNPKKNLSGLHAAITVEVFAETHARLSTAAEKVGLSPKRLLSTLADYALGKLDAGEISLGGPLPQKGGAA